jgi:hypothetical protein
VATRQPTGADYTALENIIDRSSVREVLNAIGVICQEKAAHIAENWQDEALSMKWDRAGEKIRDFAGKVSGAPGIV